MADQQASVRLGLKADGFKRGLKDSTRDASRAGSSMGKGMASGLNAGAKAGLDSFKSMFSAIKTGAASIASIVGGIGIAGLAKGAIDAERKFRRLAFTMGAGTGKFIEYERVQRKAQESALRWGVDSEKLADAMDTVFNTVGDGEFTFETIDDIARAMRATNQSAEALAPLVAEANRQFGVTADEIDEVLPAIISLGSRGGLSVQDLGANLGKLGRTAGVAGLKGEKGLRLLLAMVNQISAASGTAEGSVDKLQVIFTKLSGTQGAAFLKGLGLDVAELDTLGRLETVLDKSKSSPELLTKVFGEQGVFIKQAFGGFEDLGAAMTKAAQASIGAADMQEQAEANLQTSGANIDKALETLKQAFTKPQMMSAMESLAQNLPPLAEGLAKMLDFVVNNPALAVGGFMGAKALGAGASGALGSLIQGAGVTAGQSMASSITSAGASAGANMGGQIAGAGATAAAAFGVAMAVHQAQQLEKTKSQARDDIGIQRRMVLQNAERQGDTVAFRERNPLQDAIATKGVFGLTIQDFFDDRTLERVERDKAGNITARAVRPGAQNFEAVSVPFQDAGGPDGPGASDAELSEVRKAIEARYAKLDAQKAARGVAPDGVEPAGGGGNQQSGLDQSAGARMTADAIAGKTLRVRVLNMPAGNKPLSAGQPPSAGHAK